MVLFSKSFPDLGLQLRNEALEHPWEMSFRIQTALTQNLWFSTRTKLQKPSLCLSSEGIPRSISIAERSWTAYIGLILLPNTSVPDTQWGQTNRNDGLWSKERFTAGPCEENGWLMPKKTLNSPKGFSNSFLKGRWGGISQGMWSTHARFSHWLMLR